MSKQKKPRTKKYSPRKYDPAGGLRALIRIEDRAIANSPINHDKQSEILILARLALLNLTNGSGSAESWACIACSLRIGIVLCETVFFGQHVDVYEKALEGAAKCDLRSQKTGVHRLDGDSIQAIKHALDVHEQVLKSCTQSEILAAMAIIQQRIQEGDTYESHRVE